MSRVSTLTGKPHQNCLQQLVFCEGREGKICGKTPRLTSGKQGRKRYIFPEPRSSVKRMVPETEVPVGPFEAKRMLPGRWFYRPPRRSASRSLPWRPSGGQRSGEDVAERSASPAGIVPTTDRMLIRVEMTTPINPIQRTVSRPIHRKHSRTRTTTTTQILP